MKRTNTDWTHVFIALVAVLTSLVNLTKCSPAMTFFKFRDNVETSDASASFPNVSIVTCGMECFKVGLKRCLGYQWRPPVNNALFDQVNHFDNDDPLPSAFTTKSPLVASNLLGQCGLLECVPDPSTLVSAIGSHIYLFRGKSNGNFATAQAPESYNMACTYAYRIYDKIWLSYADAEKQCEVDGARLLTIKSHHQEEEIQLVIQPGDSYWIGVTDRKKEGEWLMSDGSIPSYDNWDSGQPNNYRKNGEDQDCAMLFLGKWNDNQCSQKLPFICQIVFVEV